MAKLSVAVLLLVGTIPLAAQHVVCRTNYYTVTGATLRDIHLSFRQNRPSRSTEGHDAFTVWNVNWRFTTAQGSSACRLATFSTTTTINITLPRWVAPTNAADTLKAEWDRYITALGRHEYGHAQLALVAAAEMQKGIKDVQTDPSCENLKQRINSVCQSVVEKYKQMDQSYDQRTDHGRKDGALLGRFGLPPPRQ